ncbi:MAG TPA: class I SAM-dependent methyltransferase [Phycisphaerales bacterium]|nr:class I SAM-dependent methyltransferase [Phycisphaerales bacterium]HMP37924.1 class I SAM-dependent methyltransferase [Phycisphaerales bacterium]
MRFDPTIHERVLETYAALGLPRERIESWCLPRRDAALLVEALAPERHRRILEVGTYVGVSTMLLALHLPTATIDTIDPDLPLEVGTPTGGAASPIERCGALSIARAAAERLGVAARVRCHRGGFAVAADYASRRGAAAATASEPCDEPPRRSGAGSSEAGGRESGTVGAASGLSDERGSRGGVEVGGEAPRAAGGGARSIVGPAVAKAHGPFDFIFVDGLHYAEAVEADLELAVGHLAPGGTIALHDVVGLWGENVRWAVHRFLERHPEFVLRHEPYREIYLAGGVLRRRADLEHEHARSAWDAHPERPAGERLIDDPGFRALLLAACLDGAPPERIIELRVPGMPSMERTALALGVRAFCRIDASAGLPGATEPCASGGELVLALGALDSLDDPGVDRLLTAIRARGAPMLLGATPPGERGADGRFSRTLPTLVALLARADLEITEDLRLRLDPSLAPYWTGKARPNSHLLHLFVVKRASGAALRGSGPLSPDRGGVAAGAPASRSPACEPLGAAAAERAALATLYRDLLILHLMGRLPAPSAEHAALLAANAAALARESSPEGEAVVEAGSAPVRRPSESDGAGRSESPNQTRLSQAEPDAAAPSDAVRRARDGSREQPGPRRLAERLGADGPRSADESLAARRGAASTPRSGVAAPAPDERGERPR